MGFIDVIVEAAFKRWDVAALIPLSKAQAASSPTGRADRIPKAAAVVAAGDARIHAAALCDVENVAN